MPRERKKKEIIEEQPTNIKNCCYWANCTKFCSPEKKFLCCAFCSTLSCSVRCKDYKDDCENLTDNKFHNIEPYINNQKLIKNKEKEVKPITEETVKRGRGRPKKS